MRKSGIHQRPTFSLEEVHFAEDSSSPEVQSLITPLEIIPNGDPPAMGRSQTTPAAISLAQINASESQMRESDDRHYLERNLSTFMDSDIAKGSLVALLSGLYALILVILAFAFELSNIVTETSNPSKYLHFYIYLYVVGLLFFGYCYIFLLRSKGYGTWATYRSRIVNFVRKSSGKTPEPGEVINGFLPDNQWILSKKRKVTYSAHSAGSLYLRLGAVVFGVIGMISNALSIAGVAELYSMGCPNPILLTALILSTIFTFVQLYFVFLNSKLTIHRFKKIGRLGTMHLVATNLCVWIQSIVKEVYEVINETHHNELNRNSTASHTVMHHGHAIHVYNMNESCEHRTSVYDSSLKEVRPFMITCLIEYSVICAATMYIMWHNIGLNLSKFQKHRKEAIRMDCSASTKGLFTGLLFIIFVAVQMFCYYVKVSQQKDTDARYIFSTADTILYAVGILACIQGMAKIRSLKYIPQTENVIMLDDVLLLVSLTGQLTYCLFSITATPFEKNSDYLVVLVNFLRLLQVLLQTIFILTAQRLIALTPESQQSKPGRETVTFLLVVNIALWLVNTFEMQNSTSIVDFESKKSLITMVHSTVPLCIFFRFHSSVCFAEIWKNAYKTK